MGTMTLSERMKSYEQTTQLHLPRRTYTIIRVDGRAFHSYTRRCERPFDQDLASAMDATAQACCTDFANCQLAYIQSDEISFLLSDFSEINTEPWFAANVQKLVSVSAANTTAEFNRYRNMTTFRIETAQFDSRVFTIPDPIEVENYFIWRQQDATRNSIAMAAQHYYSPRELLNMNTSEQQEMLFLRGVNWNDYPNGFKRGRCAIKVQDQGWQIEVPPIFTQDRAYLGTKIPRLSDSAGVDILRIHTPSNADSSTTPPKKLCKG